MYAGSSVAREGIAMPLARVILSPRRCVDDHRTVVLIIFASQSVCEFFRGQGWKEGQGRGWFSEKLFADFDLLSMERVGDMTYM